MARAPRCAVAVVLVAAAVSAGCTVGPSQRPPVAVRGDVAVVPAPPPSTPPPSEVLPEPSPQQAVIPFTPCSPDVLGAVPATPDRALRADCGELMVPVDPDRPGYGAAVLGVIRVGAADAPTDRPPLLALGDTAGEPTAYHAARLAAVVAPEVLARYTIVGLDRRGAGLDLLDCATDEDRAALLDADPLGLDPAAVPEAVDVLLTRSRELVQDCNIDRDGVLTDLRSVTAAADVEELRAALGVDRLSAIGVGDGATALAHWAGAAPGAVGRLVLDAPLDPTAGDPGRAEGEAAAAEDAFAAFVTACPPADCALGPDAAGAVFALLDRLREQPLVAADGRRLTAGATLAALRAGLGEPTGWPALAAALAAAGAGDPRPLLAALEPVAGPGGRFAAALATTCNDTDGRLAPAAVVELTERWRTDHPLFGGAAAARLVSCAGWPTGGTPAPGSAAGAPPVLVLGGAADPRGPQEGAMAVADALAPARFLDWQGAGTGAYPRTPCVRAVVDAMLVDGVPPRRDILCPP